MALNNFLKDYGNRKLKDITIPGSHDAGIVMGGVEKLSFFGSAGSNVITQNKSVAEQANSGSRFFDVRVMLHGGELVSFHSAPMKKLGFNSDSRIFGGKGQGFLEILNQLKGFVVSNPTEFVIVRLTHLMDSHEVLQSVVDWMNEGRNIAYVCTRSGNLANALVSELAGKLVIVVEAHKIAKNSLKLRFEKSERVAGQRDGLHYFYACKHDRALPEVNNGLCVCGEFSNANKVANIVKGQMKEYTFHDRHKSNREDLAHLQCVYWTATWGDIKMHTQNLMPPIFNDMMKKMLFQNAFFQPDDDSDKSRSETYERYNAVRREISLNSVSIPNIVLYDFINDQMSTEIVKMNDIYRDRSI